MGWGKGDDGEGGEEVGEEVRTAAGAGTQAVEEQMERDRGARRSAASQVPAAALPAQVLGKRGPPGSPPALTWGLQLRILCPVPDLPSRPAPATLAPPNPARSGRFRPQHLHLVGRPRPRPCQPIIGCCSRQSHSRWLKDRHPCKSGWARRRVHWLALAERSFLIWALIGSAAPTKK
jgi:hypothetical protein